MTQIILTGRPITKKNSQGAFLIQLITNPKSRTCCPVCRTRLFGKFNLVPSKAYQEYEKDCLRQLKGYSSQRFNGKIILHCVYWMPDRRSQPDLVGLLQATQDIIQKAKIIRDDQDVVGLGNSHIAGYDKERPRVEITIEEVGA